MSWFGIWHWVIVLLFVLPAWPAWRIAKRAGFAAPFALLIIPPILNLIVLWLFAFVKWPIDRRIAGKVT